MGEVELTKVERINAEYRSFEGHFRHAAQHAIRCGELLEEQKASLGHGEWLPWLRENFEGSERHAQRFMKLAREQRELDPTHVSDLSLRGALRQLSAPATVPEAENGEEAHFGDAGEEPEEGESKKADGEDKAPPRDEGIAALRSQLEEQRAEAEKREAELKTEHEAEIKRINELEEQKREALHLRKQREVAETYAQNGIEEKQTPRLSEVSVEDWKRILGEVKKERISNSRFAFTKLFSSVKSLGNYHVFEVADWIYKDVSQSGGKWEIRDLEEGINWLTELKEEMERRSRPGKLQAVKGEKDDPCSGLD